MKTGNLCNSSESDENEERLGRIVVHTGPLGKAYGEVF